MEFKPHTGLNTNREGNVIVGLKGAVFWGQEIDVVVSVRVSKGGTRQSVETRPIINRVKERPRAR